MKIRAMTEGDRAEVVSMLETSLGPAPGGVSRRELFEWKHFGNPFGRSMALVAEEDGGRIAGLRTFLRWRFAIRNGNAELGVVHAVRAVDTATRPDMARQGVFTALTRAGLEQCEREGVEFVFNTPNPKSLAGYRKMGWTPVARWPVRVRAAKRLRLVAAAATRNLRAGAAVDPAGDSPLRPAEPVTFDEPGMVSLLERMPKPPQGLFTPRSSLYLRWRYGECPVAYYVLTEGGDPPDVAAVLRIRRRGRLIEAVVCELLVAEGAGAAAVSLLRSVREASGADHVLALATGGGPPAAALSAARFRRIPRMGIEFVARQVPPAPEGQGRAASLPGADPLDPSNWVLSLGDIELL